MPLTASKKFKIAISQDQMTATLSVNGEALPVEVSVDGLVKELKELGLKLSESAKKAIPEYIATILAKKMPEALVIATGTAPVADQNGYIKKLYAEPEKPEPPKIQEDGTVATAQDDEKSVVCNANPVKPDGNGSDSKSHYEKSCYVFVDADQPIAQIMPPVEGKDGEDVFGKTVPRAKGLQASIKLGKNVRFGDTTKKNSLEKADTVYANEYGKLGHSTSKIWVDTDLEVHSDVDFSVGNIDFKNNVDIYRNVLDLFKVKAGKDLIIRGVIEAAHAEAGHDLFLRGGMAGKEKGIAIAGNNIQCKFISSAKITCGGDLLFAKEVMYSDIQCAGAIKSETGQLAGGTISAFKGVCVYTLGSDAGSKTCLEIGMNEELKARVATTKPEVKILRMKAQKVREIVEPLLKNQKRLTNEQKEKATELLYETYELDSKADDLLDKLKQAYLNSVKNSVLCVDVLGKIHPNVSIRFPRGESRIVGEIAGPVRIVPEIINRVTRLTVTNTKTGISKQLDYGSSYDEQWNELEEYLELK